MLESRNSTLFVMIGEYVEGMVDKRDPLTYDIIGAAIEIHRELGPGLLESAYDDFLCLELALINFYSHPLIDGIKRFVL